MVRPKTVHSNRCGLPGGEPMTLHPTPIAAAAALALLSTVSSVQAQLADQKPREPARLETVTVTGIRASREQSINQKRNADSIVEVITAEDIGKLPDKNVADAVQRIPGVNISSGAGGEGDRKSTRLNSSHVSISYAVFCLKKKKRTLLTSAS